MMKRFKLDYQSPIGILEIEGTATHIVSILFSEQEQLINVPHKDTPQILIECHHQIHEYFIGERQEFNISYDFEGTVFQKDVWNALTNIVYGETASYKDIAVSIGNERAVRAVGSAIGANPILAIIPCHRVIGKNGKLTGFRSGLAMKEFLLELERV